jgi:hypothetical protein
MKRVLVALVALVTFGCGAVQAAVLSYTLPGSALVVQPTALTEEYQSSFVIPDAFAVQDVNLTLHGLKATGGGLVSLIFLLSYVPTGFDPFDPGAPLDTTVVLMNGLSLGSSGNPPPPSFVDGDFTFDDEAALSITAITPATPEALALRSGGTFRPEADPLSDLDGLSSKSLGGITVAGGTFPTPGGAWLLTIRSVSTNIGATVGEFESATLTLTGTPDVTPVPEPSTWATMLLGFAGMGVWMQRRRADLS